MLAYPQIDPVALTIGPVKVHWYGLMYVIGIAAAWWLTRRRASRPGFPWSVGQIEDLIFYAAIGLVIGGRLGYILFYNTQAFLAEPLMILRVWEGGMAFHGGLLGVLAAVLWFGWRNAIGFFELTDFIAPYVPIGLFAGRIGNFINGELWGRPTDVPWAMVFPHAGPEPRHPSQLYEAFLEGIVLFVVLRLFQKFRPPIMATSGLFLLVYGLCRTAVEFFRTPDAHLGFIAFDWLTMGQLLSLPMIVLGVVFLAWAYQKKRYSSAVLNGLSSDGEGAR